MKDDRKISDYSFSEMNFSFVNTINLRKDERYIEGQFRVGAEIYKIFQAKEINGKVKFV